MFRDLLRSLYWCLPIKSKQKRWFLDSIRSKGFFYTLIPMKRRMSDTNSDIYSSYTKQVLDSARMKSNSFEKDFLDQDTIDSNVVKPIAYYLTQFHPNEKNDEWWGKGITEWNNVFRGVPQYLGHYQPTIPGELGAYDLRLKSNMARQIELASKSGIEGFAFYFYWFNGDRLLEKPFDLFLESTDLKIDFMICWANESWTRRFDGASSEVLMGFKGDFDSNKDFIDDNASIFTDKRYMKSDGKCVIQIYRPSNFDNVKELISHWRLRAKELFGEVHFMAVSFGSDYKEDWISHGFDSISDFQPGSMMSYRDYEKINKKLDIVNEDFVGTIYDYADIAADAPFRQGVYPAVMPSWDNSARRVDSGLIFHNSTPELYGDWLDSACRNVLVDDSLNENFVFLNAWNEWGEGAYLEPDKKFGYAYLNTTRRVVGQINLEFE
ncbi:glycoside hydrolase family 99-like domain-containing protein [Shewanella sp. ULN5]|uniref:glycosyltransferase WbsX family protein n=1 Tax=Shewanella sp. ULN5 TaxID=2994678 RepID=UPI00273CFC27|nr:glycoside hydrolase family 99-like domain-containing protein [Shewanella sp. ULN5]MDP5145071.1 glycoside hydrolase family 99-like domain-containing protein [Shewanella sp. ULN5]